MIYRYSVYLEHGFVAKKKTKPAKIPMLLGLILQGGTGTPQGSLENGLFSPMIDSIHGAVSME